MKLRVSLTARAGRRHGDSRERSRGRREDVVDLTREWVNLELFVRG